MGYNWLYIFLYYLVHLIYTIFEIISSISERIYWKFIWQTFVPVNTKELESDFVKYKIPNHLTILLGHEQPSYSDLSNMIIWCIASRINFVSFYDHKGELKRNQQLLAYEINKKKRNDDHIIWHDDPSTAFKNGFVGRKIHIKVLTKADGRLALVNYVRTSLKTSNSFDCSVQRINEGLRKQFEFPDPDLGIYCGKTFSLYSYPPWQIRVTEFFNISSHHNISLLQFKDVLKSYSGCEQRLGK